MKSSAAKDPSRASATSSGNCRKSTEEWKRHIVRQLRHRDKCQHAMFRDVVQLYTLLLEKTTFTEGLLHPAARLPSDDSSVLVSDLISQNKDLKEITGELAYQVVALQRDVRRRENVLQHQYSSRLTEVQCLLSGAKAEQQNLQSQIAQVQEGNCVLKKDYDALLLRHRVVDETFRQENVRGCKVLEQMIHWKEQAAVHVNNCNERRSRARAASIQRELQTAANVTVDIDLSESPVDEAQDKPETRHARYFRSASVTSPRILNSIKELFEKKRRGSSVCSLEEDFSPVGICVVARLPVRALHVLDAHEQGINAVKFSSSLVATGGTDRLIKLWDVKAGMLHHRGTLDGSTEGITSIEFDPVGTRILAASYDKSALLWRLDESVPQVTLTGHSRKVTSAKFKCGLHQVVTGSADRTLKLWDVHRAACIQTIVAVSYCSDLVTCDNCIISGHYDSKIRLWDTRVARCSQELPAQGKVTSLDIYPAHRHLLSCCRDDCLQLMDLRRSNPRLCFRADGFKCGNDSTKAVFSPDGGFVAAGSADGAVYIWSVSTGHLETRLPNKHSSSISAVAWSPSGDYVVSVDKSRRAILWSDI